MHWFDFFISEVYTCLHRNNKIIKSLSHKKIMFIKNIVSSKKILACSYG